MKPGQVPRAGIRVATGNPGKLAEIRSILSAWPLRLEALPAAPGVIFPPEGDDYAENALAKARAVAQQLGSWAVADDSGLEVDALDAAPGPRSARYGGPGLDDRARVQRLLGALSGVPAERRGARFVCAAVGVTPAGVEWIAWGECRGRILAAPCGQRGFGYDPIFQPDAHAAGGRSMAELEGALKDRISHRGRAFRSLARKLPPVGAQVEICDRRRST